jgi:EAL domain-containing protein (putative c-di-GMP-specific phosphodiesterase class I)
MEDILHLLRYVRLNTMDFSENETIRIDQSSLDAMYHEIETEELILDAIENERFEVYYQPIYSTADRTFTAAEALVRIRDSENQIVLPGAFIETAEKNGMIIQLGEIVFEKVCQFIQKHNPRQYGLKYIEVNLSVVQCTYEHLAESFIRIMEKYHIDPAWINFEITESASVSSRKTLLENINQLTSYGIQFSLDDFGTGHSNLNYIVDMPIHIVKFDRDMTVSYFENQKARYVMDAAMLMIKRMNLKIVSEGIETEEQYKVMHSLGIHYIQGFYFSKPLSYAAFLDFLKTKN